jgi:hypothetical protein
MINLERFTVKQQKVLLEAAINLQLDKSKVDLKAVWSIVSERFDIPQKMSAFIVEIAIELKRIFNLG